MIDELERKIIELEKFEYFNIAKISIENIEILLNEISILSSKIEEKLNKG